MRGQVIKGEQISVTLEKKPRRLSKNGLVRLHHLERTGDHLGTIMNE